MLVVVVRDMKSRSPVAVPSFPRLSAWGADCRHPAVLRPPRLPGTPPPKEAPRILT